MNAAPAGLGFVSTRLSGWPMPTTRRTLLTPAAVANSRSAGEVGALRTERPPVPQLTSAACGVRTRV